MTRAPEDAADETSLAGVSVIVSSTPVADALSVTEAPDVTVSPISELVGMTRAPEDAELSLIEDSADDKVPLVADSAEVDVDPSKTEALVEPCKLDVVVAPVVAVTVAKTAGSTGGQVPVFGGPIINRGYTRRTAFPV